MTRLIPTKCIHITSGVLLMRHWLGTISRHQLAFKGWMWQPWPQITHYEPVSVQDRRICIPWPNVTSPWRLSTLLGFGLLVPDWIENKLSIPKCVFLTFGGKFDCHSVIPVIQPASIKLLHLWHKGKISCCFDGQFSHITCNALLVLVVSKKI